MRVAMSILYMVVGLIFILEAYTLVAYPLMEEIGSLIAHSKDFRVVVLYSQVLYVLGAVGLIFAVSLVIWVVLRLAKKEVFDLD